MAQHLIGRTPTRQAGSRQAAKRAALAGLSLLLIACNSLSAYEPVMVDDDQVFAIQAQDVRTTTTGTVSYDWTNPQTQATVYQATTTFGAGSASVRITDAAGTLVYSSALQADRIALTAKGMPGLWKIVVTMTGYTGTLGFQVLAGIP